MSVRKVGQEVANLGAGVLLHEVAAGDEVGAFGVRPGVVPLGGEDVRGEDIILASPDDGCRQVQATDAVLEPDESLRGYVGIGFNRD